MCWSDFRIDRNLCYVPLRASQKVIDTMNHTLESTLQAHGLDPQENALLKKHGGKGDQCLWLEMIECAWPGNSHTRTGYPPAAPGG